MRDMVRNLSNYLRGLILNGLITSTTITLGPVAFASSSSQQVSNIIDFDDVGVGTQLATQVVQASRLVMGQLEYELGATRRVLDAILQEEAFQDASVMAYVYRVWDALEGYRGDGSAPTENPFQALMQRYAQLTSDLQGRREELFRELDSAALWTRLMCAATNSRDVELPERFIVSVSERPVEIDLADIDAALSVQGLEWE